MTTKKPTVASRFAVIKINYSRYVLPVADATAIVSALANAELLESDGYGDNIMYFIGGGGPIDLDLELLPEHQYLQGKFAGPKATYTETENTNV